jgi:predicted ArsR family transcriptional regulator
MNKTSDFLKNSFEKKGSAADRLLTLLKRRGPQTAAELGAALGVTDEAARQQLLKMAGEGLVEGFAENRGVGRPKQVWKLTAAGNGRFPDAHAELTERLISTIRSVLGEEALDRVIAAREAETLANYLEEMEGAGAIDLEDRVRRLASFRDREGYMCEFKIDGDEYLLIENHCPICAAANSCQNFCRSEMRIFERVLGDGVLVTREEHIVSGARRCAYRIAAIGGKNEKTRR